MMMVMRILTGDPDRACRVACQDSKISYRFFGGADNNDDNYDDLNDVFVVGRQ